MKISDIILPDEYIFTEIDPSNEISKPTIDCKRPGADDILIIPSQKWAAELSRSKSAPLAVICDANTTLPENMPAIRVNNPRLAMARAFYRYENPNLDRMKIIGITGTNGKTSTASLINYILSQCGYKTGFIGTGKIEINGSTVNKDFYSMTTPDPPLLYKSLRQMSDAGCDVVIMEVSSHALSLNKVDPILFDYGIFTNLSAEHMDFHGDIESYYAAKLRLFSSCKCGVFNIDDKYAARAYKSFDGRKISVGIIWRGDAWVTNIEQKNLSGTDYIYHTDRFSCKMSLSLPGSFNIYNSMIAATICIDMGCKPCEVKKAIGGISSIPGRYEIIKDEISVIIDYAHTPEAFKAILSELNKQKNGRRITVVFGCGGDRDKTKRPAMAEIAEKYADRVIVTSDNSRNEKTQDIISDITRGFKQGNYEVKEDRKEAITSAIATARKEDIIAILGKGAEKYNIDSSGYHQFDEREIVQRALLLRKNKEI